MYLPALSPIRTFFALAQWGGGSVITVWGDPDRADTEAQKAYRKRLAGKLTKQQVEDAPTPVPFMSIWRSFPAFDQSRDSRAVIRGFNVNRKAGTALKMRYPRPLTTDVQVDLWCGEAGGKIAEVVAAQIEMLFPNESVYLPIDWALDKFYEPPFDVFLHAKHYGRTRGRLVQTQGWVDNTQLERAQGTKEVRLTWQGRYDFEVPYRPEEGRIVRDLVIELFDDFSGELIETLNAGAED